MIYPKDFPAELARIRAAKTRSELMDIFMAQQCKGPTPGQVRTLNKVFNERWYELPSERKGEYPFRGPGCCKEKAKVPLPLRHPGRKGEQDSGGNPAT